MSAVNGINTVYLGLGGNIGDAEKTLKSALNCIRNLSDVIDVEAAPLFQTVPISPIPQPLFVNTVCRVRTRLSIRAFFKLTESIEMAHGKWCEVFKKEKTHPRRLDIDVILLNNQEFEDDKLIIPHQQWDKRLFVLKPLSYLVNEIEVRGPRVGKKTYDISKMIRQFPLKERSEVVMLDDKKNKKGKRYALRSDQKVQDRTQPTIDSFFRTLRNRERIADTQGGGTPQEVI